MNYRRWCVSTPPPALFSASPDGKWVVLPGSNRRNCVVGDAVPGRRRFPHATVQDVYQVATTLSVLGPPGVSWSPDGKFLYLNFPDSMYAIRLRSGQMLPPIPTSGFRSKEDVAALPNARLIPEQGAFPRPQPIPLCFHESWHPPQHLPGFRTLMKGSSSLRSNVDDVAASARFYQRIFGFSIVSDFGRPRLRHASR